MENKFQLKPSDRASIDFAEEERKRVDEEGSVVHEDRIANVEHVEVIYDKSSSDINLNWGYTGGIRNDVQITGKDFSKYKKIRAYFQETWDGYSNSMASVEVYLNPIFLLSGSYYAGGITKQVQHYNGIYAHNYAIVVSSDKTAITPKSFRVNPDGSVTEINGCFLIEGVY